MVLFKTIFHEPGWKRLLSICNSVLAAECRRCAAGHLLYDSVWRGTAAAISAQISELLKLSLKLYRP